MRKIYKSKTVWTGLATLVAAAGGFFTGSMAAPEALQLAATGLTAIFLRHGVEKNKPETDG